MQMYDEKKLIGSRILSEANNLKRNLESLAHEMSLDIDYVKSVCDGSTTRENQVDFIHLMSRYYPIDPYRLLFYKDDSMFGVKIMRARTSRATSRVFKRKTSKNNCLSAYYEYRDTAMSAHSPFRPEWIKMLRIVNDNDPDNSDAIYNNGHFLHQNTFFVGPVNFYYKIDGISYCEEMVTGDSNYITPFIPHTFTSRSRDEEALIIAVTYAGQAYNCLNDLYCMGRKKISEFCIPRKDKNKGISRLVMQKLNDNCITPKQASSVYDIDIDILVSETEDKPKHLLSKLAKVLNIHPSELTMPEYDINQEVVVKKYSNCKGYFYPSDESPSCYITPLAKSSKMKNVNAFHIKINNDLSAKDFAFNTSMHTYLFHLGSSEVIFSWEYQGEWYDEKLHEGDSVYIKPFTKYLFRTAIGSNIDSRIFMVRVPGSVTNEIQKEISLFSSPDRIIENICWY